MAAYIEAEEVEAPHVELREEQAAQAAGAVTITHKRPGDKF